MLIVLRTVKSPSGSEEVAQVQVETVEQKQSLVRTSWDLLVGMFRTVFKKRSGWMTTCILLQLLAYTVINIL